MIYIEIVIMLLCGYSYLKKKYGVFFVLLIVLLSNFFYFLPIANKGTSRMYLHLMILVIAVIESVRDVSFFSVKEDSIGKSILLILAFYLFHSILTVVLALDSFGHSFYVFCKELYLLSYFLFRRISLEAIDNKLKILFSLIVIQTLAYYLQFLGIDLLYGSFKEGFLNGLTRYTNVPQLGGFVLLYFLLAKHRIDNRLLWILFFTPVIILPMVRGYIIAFSLAVIVVFYINKDYNLIKKFMVFGGFVLLLFSPILVDRFKGNTDSGFINEMEIVCNMKNSSDFNYGESDTFSFRIALLFERLEYMKAHAYTFLTGVGSLYETCDLVPKFGFLIGSSSPDANGILYHRQVETTDISFITHFFRYGVTYLLFISFFIYRTTKVLYRNRNENILFAVTFVIMIQSLVQCLSSVPFYDFSLNRMFPFLLILGLIKCQNMKSQY